MDNEKFADQFYKVTKQFQDGLIAQDEYLQELLWIYEKGCMDSRVEFNTVRIAMSLIMGMMAMDDNTKHKIDQIKSELYGPLLNWKA